MTGSGIAQGGERRKPRPEAEAVIGAPHGGEDLLDGPSGVLVSSTPPTQAKILLLQPAFVVRMTDSEINLRHTIGSERNN